MYFAIYTQKPVFQSIRYDIYDQKQGGGQKKKRTSL